MRKRNLAELIAVLFKAFEKESDEDLAELYYQRLKGHNLEIIEKRILELLDTSKFFPRIAEILDYSTKIEEAEEIKFLARFKKQAGSPYAFTKVDDDVYTVKKYVGPRLIEDAYTKDWLWIEKKVLKVYRAIREQYIEVIENPNTARIKELPSGNGRFIESSSTKRLSNALSSVRSSLPKHLVQPEEKNEEVRSNGHDETKQSEKISAAFTQAVQTSNKATVCA